MLVVFAQLVLVNYFPVREAAINNTFALVAQITGGLLVLYSIDSNIGIVKQESLYSIFTRYFKDFPLFKKSVSITVGASMHTQSSARARLTVKKHPQSLEEKVAYLQEQIDEIRGEFKEDLKELDTKVDRKDKKQSEKITTLTESVDGIESKVNQVAVGGLKVQVFGVILLIYAAVCGYVA
jgi:hypothetical protein